MTICILLCILLTVKHRHSSILSAVTRGDASCQVLNTLLKQSPSNLIMRPAQVQGAILKASANANVRQVGCTCTACSIPTSTTSRDMGHPGTPWRGMIQALRLPRKARLNVFLLEFIFGSAGASPGFQSLQVCMQEHIKSLSSLELEFKLKQAQPRMSTKGAGPCG